jgi:hypothetical protein
VAAAIFNLMKKIVDQIPSASARVRASDSILKHAAKASEINDVETRDGVGARAGDAENGGRTRGRLNKRKE